MCRTKQLNDLLNTAVVVSGSVSDRETYMATLIANGLKDMTSINVIGTPWTGAASNGSSCRSWLGDYIKWTKFDDVRDRNWWKETFL